MKNNIKKAPVKFLGRWVIFSAFYADFYLCPKSVIITTLRGKFMECSINSQALSLLIKHLVIGQRLKTPNFSAFHWSPCGSLVSIGQYFVASRVVHLQKSTETSLITESDQSGPNYQLL